MSGVKAIRSCLLALTLAAAGAQATSAQGRVDAAGNPVCRQPAPKPSAADCYFAAGRDPAKLAHCDALFPPKLLREPLVGSVISREALACLDALDAARAPRPQSPAGPADDARCILAANGDSKRLALCQGQEQQRSEAPKGPNDPWAAAKRLDECYANAGDDEVKLSTCDALGNLQTLLLPLAD